MASPVLSTELRNLTWVPVSSSNVAAVGYTPDFARFWVSFHNGSVYVYHDCPEVHYQGIQTAGSPGGYLAQHVKGRYGYTRVM